MKLLEVVVRLLPIKINETVNDNLEKLTSKVKSISRYKLEKKHAYSEIFEEAFAYRWS